MLRRFQQFLHIGSGLDLPAATPLCARVYGAREAWYYDEGGSAPSGNRESFIEPGLRIVHCHRDQLEIAMQLGVNGLEAEHAEYSSADVYALAIDEQERDVTAKFCAAKAVSTTIP